MITAWRHEDEKVQREFERIYDLFGNAKKETQSVSKKVSTTQQTTAPVNGALKVHKGFISLNRLPRDPATMPPNTPVGELYKYRFFEETVPNGRYGWYVYNVIEHGLKLADPKKFIIHFYDADEFVGNPDHSVRFAEKVAEPHYEPLDQNRIYVWGILKPDIMTEYKGHTFVQELPIIDYARGIVSTNLNFHYAIIGS